MSEEHMTRYRELYSEYIERAVNLHNYHQVFITHVGYDSGLAVIKNLRAMVKLEKDLIRTCRKAYREHKQNVKDMKQREKEEYLAWKKANTRPRGRPKKEKNNVNNRTD